MCIQNLRTFQTNFIFQPFSRLIFFIFSQQVIYSNYRAPISSSNLTQVPLYYQIQVRPYKIYSHPFLFFFTCKRFYTHFPRGNSISGLIGIKNRRCFRGLDWRHKGESPPTIFPLPTFGLDSPCTSDEHNCALVSLREIVSADFFVDDDFY